MAEAEADAIDELISICNLPGLVANLDYDVNGIGIEVARYDREPPASSSSSQVNMLDQQFGAFPASASLVSFICSHSHEERATVKEFDRGTLFAHYTLLCPRYEHDE